MDQKVGRDLYLLPLAVVVFSPDFNRFCLLTLVAFHHLCFSHFSKPWFWLISLTVIFQGVVLPTQLTGAVVRIQLRVVLGKIKVSKLLSHFHLLIQVTIMLSPPCGAFLADISLCWHHL